MQTPRNEDLARASAESQQHILKASASCEESRAHVRASKLAIDRSLQLLGETRDATRER